MKLFTKTEIQISKCRIDYTNKIFFIGSCLADNIAKKFLDVKFNVLSNPFGTVYNPLSINSFFKKVIQNKKYTSGDIFQEYSPNGVWHSFDATSKLSARTPEECIELLNDSLTCTRFYLTDARVVFITLGTAYAYFLKENGQVVSNCHKQNPDIFFRRLLSTEEISKALKETIKNLHLLNPDLKFIFTVSPLRHLKDGLHGNTLSKATLQVALNQVIEEFSNTSISVEYFPSYEIVLDELRDYRFYKSDMIHLSETAEEYIFEKIAETFFDEETFQNVQKVQKFMKSANHVVINPENSKEFAEKHLREAVSLESEISGLDLSKEKSHFESILSLKF